MFDKTLKENANETFQMAEKALKKIIDGEVTYQNFRNYVINLHNSYELYFKYKLLEKNEFMLFSLAVSLVKHTTTYFQKKLHLQ